MIPISNRFHRLSSPSATFNTEVGIAENPIFIQYDREMVIGNLENFEVNIIKITNIGAANHSLV